MIRHKGRGGEGRGASIKLLTCNCIIFDGGLLLGPIIFSVADAHREL